MNLVLLSFTDLPPTEPSGFPGVCPEDVQTSDTEQNYFWILCKGYCYKFFTEIIEWADASASCVRHGKSCLWPECEMWLSETISLH